MNQQSPTSKIKLILLGVAVVALVGLFFYVRNEQQQLDAFEAEQEEKFGNHVAGGDAKAFGKAQNDPTIDLKLLSLRVKLEREREASPLGKPLQTEGMSPNEVQKIKALRLELSRSYAGRFSREQIHLIVPAIKRMLRDPSSTAVATDQNRENRANLSWRVHLLPYIGEGELYDRFKLDEPWDSPANKRLLSQMPKLYRGFYDKKDAIVTRLMAIEMPDSFAIGGRLRSLSELVDPEEDTAGLIIVGTKLAQPWTKPADFQTANKFADAMKFMPKPTYWIGTIEGAALRVRFDGRFETLRAMWTFTGGESNAVDAMNKETAEIMRDDK